MREWLGFRRFYHYGTLEDKFNEELEFGTMECTCGLPSLGWYIIQSLAHYCVYSGKKAEYQLRCEDVKALFKAPSQRNNDINKHKSITQERDEEMKRTCLLRT